jgi:tetratricopeptide (TPR) repeat protein
MIYKIFLLLFVISSTPVVGQEANPASSYYHFSLAKLYHLNEAYSEAVQEFEKALEADPESVSLHTEFARSLVQMGEIKRAVEICKKAAQLDPEDPEPHNILGGIYYSYGGQAEQMQDKALAAFLKVLELQPDHLEALESIAEIHREAGRFEEAAAAYARVREIAPGSFGAYFFGARALAQLGRAEEAVEILERGLRIRDDVPEYLLLLGRLYEEADELNKAIELYTNGLADIQKTDLRLTHRAGLALMKAGRFGDAIPLLEKLVNVSPEAAIDLARALRGEKRLQESVEVLEEVLRKDPHEIEANFELAKTLTVLGERERARSKFEYLTRLDDPRAEENRAVFKKNLALVYEEEGRFDEAIELLEEVVEEDPEDIDSRLTLFFTYKEASRVDEALSLTEELIQERPEGPYVLIARAQALAAAERLDEGVELLRLKSSQAEDPELLLVAASQLYFSEEMFVESATLVKEGLSEYPDSERLRFQLGAIYERQSDFGAAEEEFRKILEVNPNDADVLNYLGYMLVDRGIRLGEATEYIKRAVELDPYNGAYLDSLGWAYFKQNDTRKAEQYLQKAIRLNRSDPVIFEHLGDLYAKMEEPDRAREYYERSITYQEKLEEAERVKRKIDELGVSTVSKD